MSSNTLITILQRNCSEQIKNHVFFFQLFLDPIVVTDGCELYTYVHRYRYCMLCLLRNLNLNTVKFQASRLSNIREKLTYKLYIWFVIAEGFRLS